MKKYFSDWNLFEKLWLFTFTAINIYLFFAWHDTIIGLTASLTGMICVVLTAKAKISSFYYGIINILAYSYVAYRSAYYGDVMLNMLYFLPMSFLGIHYWKKNKDNQKKGVVRVRSLKWKNKLLWFVTAMFATLVYGLLLKVIKGTLPFIDSSTTVFSIMATILLTRRMADQWFYWIMVNVLSLVMWIYIFATTGGDISIIVMWSAFLVNAVYGYYNWKKFEKEA